MDNNGYSWENNIFWKDIKHRLEKAWSVLSGVEMSIDESSGRWMQLCSFNGASQIAFMQNRYIAGDATDRGFCICPMILDGRYYFRLGFDIYDGDSVICTHPWEITQENENAYKIKAIYELDSFTLVGSSSNGLEYVIKTIIPPSYPFILVDADIKGTVGRMVVKPWMLWMPGEMQYFENEGMLWAIPRHVSIMDKVLANNNSRTADPLRQENSNFAGIGIAFAGNSANPGIYQRLKINSQKQVVLCDRTFLAGELEKLEFNPVQGDLANGKASFSMILGVCRHETDFKNLLQKWYSQGHAEQVKEKRYWSNILDNLSVHCADKDIELQSRYSLKNSIFSRCMHDEGSTIFIHGRPDRGYGDCSKLHQSYQMHYVALASGQVGSVRDELLSFAKFQDDKGDIAIQLRPGSGCHPYAGLYSNAHFIMALYRYLSWTGDFGFVNEIAANPFSKSRFTILERLRLAAQWLLENCVDGVIKPCGWLDAWPPEVKAQAQVSIVTYMALDKLSKLLSYLRYKKEAVYFRNEAIRLAENIKDIFYNKENGLFAEHLFESGKVEGGVTEDFWAHTQVWAALAGLSPDARGLEACRKYCLKNGLTVIPETGINTDYIKNSTDGMENLNIGSTATWLLAVWPELTHLYAIAEIRYGRADIALDAVRRQLPKNIYKKNPYSAPYYYAEKYLYPHNMPWLCTWSGDPTLLQVLLEGFGGLQPTLEGLRIKPNIPAAWKGRGDYKVNFIWRGRKIKLSISGCGSRVKSIKLNERNLRIDAVIAPEMLPNRLINNVDVIIE